MGDRRPVLIYRETLLAASEPFITAQAERLSRHEPWYLGLRRADGHVVPTGRDLRWTSSSAVAPVRRYAWKRWGIAPRTATSVAALAPVLVHAHFGRDAVQLLPLVKRHSLPLVVTFHGHDATRTDASLRAGSYSDRLFLERRRALAASGARFLAVSTMIRDRLVAGGFPADRVEVHYIGVDVRGIDAVAAGVGQRDSNLVVFAGRLVPHKGLVDLIDAMARLRRPGARLVVVGDGPDRGALEQRAARAGVDATFAGFVAPREVWRWMARAAVVAVPSRTAGSGWQEAFGLVAAEAQAAGARVVASTCGGLPEAIAPANADLLFPEGDVDALLDRLAIALDARDVTAAAAARAWVAAERNLDAQTARLDAIYEEVAP